MLNLLKIIKKFILEIAADYLVMAAWLTYLKSDYCYQKMKMNEEYTRSS